MDTVENMNYDYHYSFSAEDEIVSRYSHIVDRFKTSFLFEIETHFIIQKRDGHQEMIGSETFDSIFPRIIYDEPQRKEWLIEKVHWYVSFRLRDYLVGPGLIPRFDSDAADFALRTESDPESASRNVIPIHVKFEVVTLEKQGETIEEARDRAVGPQVLVPIYLYPFSSHIRFRSFDISRSHFLMQKLPKVRVEDVVDKGLMIQVCGICSRLPNMGTRVSTIPGCNHAFHSHCIIRWLLENDLCPTCQSVAYHAPDKSIIVPPEPSHPTMRKCSSLSLSKLNIQ